MENKTFCPRCKSEDVKKDITASLVLGAPQSWICNDCGYSNLIFPELKQISKPKK